MAIANTDLESLERVGRAVASFQRETDLFARGSAHALDEFEDVVGEYACWLRERLDEASHGQGATGDEGSAQQAARGSRGRW